MLWIIGTGAVVAAIADAWPGPVTEMFRQQMTHAGWEGFHFIDLIFPLFLLLVGVILPFSILRRVEQGVPRRQLYWHIARRTAVLILLGWINYGLLRFDWAEMRWSTVLGRIGICYFAAGLLTLVVGWQWGKTFFISRNVWTSSFVLYAAGWSLLLLALFYWVIDVKGFKKWSFFLVVIGMNAITIWVGQRAIDFGYTAEYLVAGATAHLGTMQPLALASTELLLKWLFLWFLFRHKVFFKA